MNDREKDTRWCHAGAPVFASLLEGGARNWQRRSGRLAGVPGSGVVGWSPRQWRGGLESQSMAWFQTVWPINQSVGQWCQIGQSVNWSMMPVNPVNGGLSRRAAGSYGKCLPRKKIKSDNEKKRKE